MGASTGLGTVDGVLTPGFIVSPKAPRELLALRPAQLQWQEIQEQRLNPTQVRLEFRYGAAKHGTERMLLGGEVFARGDYDVDLRLFRKDESRGSFRPYVAGNLTVGEVVEVGGAVEELSLGDSVLCGAGFRERHVIDTAGLERLDCRKMPPALAWQSAVCLDPTVFALAALRDGNVRLGDTVAIFGLGAIGLVAVQLAKAMHAAMIVAVDPICERRAIAAAFGADLLIDPTHGDVGEIIRDNNGGRGMDVAIDMSGAANGMQAAIRATHFSGTVVAAAAPPRYNVGIDLGGDAHFNCLNLVFSRGCSEPNRDHPRWNMRRLYHFSWSLICKQDVSGIGIVNRVIDFDGLAEAYKAALDDSRCIKLGVQMQSAMNT